jgi:hypothetical protein
MGWQTPPTADDGGVARAPIKATAATNRSSIFLRIPGSFQVDGKATFL